MCGISGYIGNSTNPRATAELMTALFASLEERGTDASGYWGAENGNGRIIYHKEPIRSSLFVKKDFWEEAISINTDILLVHARQASIGAGHPSENKNNHPFVSTDRQIALVHNGKISEYDVLTKKYMVNTKCDSEILLRIFEAGGTDSSIESRLKGLKDIWSHVVDGHMAVAIGERMNENERRLWLFRNQFRTLWLVDLRRTLGQIFFCSTPEIWKQAISDCPRTWNRIKKKSKLVELPKDQAWVLGLRKGAGVVSNSDIKKFEVQNTGTSAFEYKGDPIEIPQKKPVCEIVTKLNEDDQLDHTPAPHGKSYNLQQWRHGDDYYGSYGDYHSKSSKNEPSEPIDVEPVDVEVSQFEKKQQGQQYRDLLENCEEIDKLVGNIKTDIWNKFQEGTLEKISLEELLQSVKDAKLELQGTLALLEHS